MAPGGLNKARTSQSQAIEKVILAATTAAPNNEEGKEDTAVGFSGFGDPNLKG